ncbi:hypothetical protein ACJBU6_08964 [Exserohilum turcicum]
MGITLPTAAAAAPTGMPNIKQQSCHDSQPPANMRLRLSHTMVNATTQAAQPSMSALNSALSPFHLAPHFNLRLEKKTRHASILGMWRETVFYNGAGLLCKQTSPNSPSLSRRMSNSFCRASDCLCTNDASASCLL